LWKQKNTEKIALIHIDSDLYSSATLILNHLNERISKGTIMIFDELCDWENQGVYERWREGEAKALIEWVNNSNRKLKPLSRTNWIEGSFLVEK